MTDTLARLTSALAERYTIERVLGEGGMAVVYLADDPNMHRKVAIKVLRPELAAAIGTERFLREIEIGGQLSHPNILPIFDSGEADGFLYYVMPFIEGESLRDRLYRETQLPLDDAMQITKEVADALGYSHDKGIMHRDIKPENILLSGGRAIVADFGIARAVTMAGGEKLTQTGMAIGTPAYMSPEQAAGVRNVDHRTDIYALACVAYEMLAGEPPYTGPTAQAIIAKRLSDPVPSIRRIRNAVSEDIDAAIEKALDKTPADRFDSTERFIQALTGERPVQSSTRSSQGVRSKQRLLVGVAVAAAVLVGGGIGLANFMSEDAEPDPITIVMAAPVAINADSTLAIVVARALERAMLESPYVQVMPPNRIAEVLASMGQEPTTVLDEATALALAERSGAGAMVASTVTGLGTAYLLNATVFAPNGETRAIAEATAQDESALIVALDSLQLALRRELGESRRSLRQSKSLTYLTTSSVEAFRLFIQADVLKFTALDQATQLLQRAIALDSTFVWAWMALGQWGAEVGQDFLLPWEHLAPLMDRLDQFNRLLTEYFVAVLVERDYARGVGTAQSLLTPQADTTSQAATATVPLSDLYNVLAVHLVDLGEFEQAEEIFPPYLAAVEQLTAMEGQREIVSAAWVNGAMMAAARHDTSTALDRLDRSGLLDPETVVVNRGWLRLHVLVEVGEYARAAEQAGLARSQTSLHRQRHGFGFLGTVEALRGRPVASRTAFTQAVRVAQEHVDPAVELAMRLQHAQAEFFVLDEPARAAVALAPVLSTTEPLVGTVRRYVAKGEALREAICDALPTAMTELPGGDLQCGAPSQVDSAMAWIETVERMGWEHLAAGRLQQATAPAASPRLPRAGGDGIRALMPAAVAYERMGMPDSAAAIYEEIVRLSAIGDAREFAGYSLAYEQYALRRLVALGGAAADDARRQLQHAWQDAEPEFARRVAEPLIGR